jgi:hypothetical protein
MKLGGRTRPQYGVPRPDHDHRNTRKFSADQSAPRRTKRLIAGGDYDRKSVGQGGQRRFCNQIVHVATVYGTGLKEVDN